MDYGVTYSPHLWVQVKFSTTMALFSSSIIEDLGVGVVLSFGQSHQSNLQSPKIHRSQNFLVKTNEEKNLLSSPKLQDLMTDLSLLISLFIKEVACFKAFTHFRIAVSHMTVTMQSWHPPFQYLFTDLKQGFPTF